MSYYAVGSDGFRQAISAGSPKEALAKAQALANRIGKRLQVVMESKSARQVRRLKEAYSAPWDSKNPRSKKNAGPFSKRKTKKVRGQGGSDSWAAHVKAKARATKAERRAKKNPAPTFGVAVVGYAPLSKGDFKSLKAARKYIGQLKARGLLYGRDVELLKFTDGKASRVSYTSYNGLAGAIKPGSRVTIADRFGKRKTGRAVMLGPSGWVLNMGGRHGTPAIADDRNTVKVSGGGTRRELMAAGNYSTRNGAKKKGPVKKKNAGPGSKRKTKKRLKRQAGTKSADTALRLLRGIKRVGGGPAKR